MKIVLITIISIVPLLPIFDDSFAKYSYDPDLTSLQVYENLDLIDLKIIDLKVIPRDDTPTALDEADLIKIKFQISKNDTGFFALSDKMFRIHVIDPGLIKDGEIIRPSKKVDTYVTSFIDIQERIGHYY